MDTRKLVLYVAVAAGAIIVLCAVIAILKSLYACCGHDRKRRRGRRHITRATISPITNTPPSHQRAPYTIAVAGQMQSHATPHHYQYGATVPPYRHAGGYAEPIQPWYGTVAGGVAMPSQFPASAPPPYNEAVNNDLYKRQEAYNPAYQDA